MICDGRGTALAFILSQGQRHDAAFFHATWDAGVEAAAAMGGPTPAKLAADKAYGAGHIRRRLAEEKVGAVIPKKRNETLDASDGPFDRPTYRRRNVVERLIGWLKHWRAVATRYDKLARNFRATLTLALIERSLRRT